MSGRLERLDRALGDQRHVALALVLRRRSTSEVLLRFGGRWDRIAHAFTGTTGLCRTLDLEESQLEAVNFFRHWMAARAARARREVVAFIGGARRGGKSTVSVDVALGYAVDVPDAIVVIVSPTFAKRDQLERQLKALVPTSWGDFYGMPEPRLRLANGSEIRLLGANDPSTLKRGRLDVVLLDDAQDMAPDAISMALPGVIDHGGIVIVAANPPRKFRGEWVLRLREAVQEGRVEDVKIIDVDPKLNERIDHETRTAVGRVLAVLDPKAAKADDEGEWLPTGERVYLEHFDPKRNLAPGALPERAITEQYTRRRGGRSFGLVGGVDFQASPHMVGTILGVFGTLERPIYHAVGEVFTEDATEEEFLHDVDDLGLRPEFLMWVGDASGQHQDGAHTADRDSFSIFKKFRWRIVPPVEKKSEKGTWSKNPAIESRINLVNRLLAEGRLLIDPERCPRLVEAIKECPMKIVNGRRRPYGRYTHVTDSLGYALCWLEPKPRPAVLPGQPPGQSFHDLKPGAGAYRGY